MLIRADTLAAMAAPKVFIETFGDYATAVLQEGRLFPKFAVQRLVETHGAWQNDLSRVGDHEPFLEEGLDHFKQAAHLAFWLRRFSPLVEAIDLTKNLADAPGYPLTHDEEAFRELLFGYANEYLAFDFGYQICKYHEIAKPAVRPARRLSCQALSIIRTRATS